MLSRKQTLKQIMPAPPGYSLLLYETPDEHNPTGDYTLQLVIAWAWIEEAFGFGDERFTQQAVVPVTLDDIGWPEIDEPVAILAPDESVHSQDGVAYGGISDWLSGCTTQWKRAQAKAAAKP